MGRIGKIREEFDDRSIIKVSLNYRDSLECLGEIHTVDIPELPDIVKGRKEPGAPESIENIVPFKRDTLKEVSNEPCFRGNGKKYKKYCLN